MPEIHATAFVASGAQLGEGVRVGPYCVIGENVRIGAKTIIRSHVVIEGRTTIGEECQIFPFTSLGHAPQDIKYKGEDTSLEIGSRNIIREHVTMNRGTVGGGAVTKVGNDGMFMTACHIAHDCVVGDQVIFANNATLGGHCQIGDFVILGGLSGVHQMVRVGRLAFIGGLTPVTKDVIPFGSAFGERGSLGGLNIVGMKRRGYTREAIHNLRRAYRMVFGGENTLTERVEQVAATYPDEAVVQELVTFIRGTSGRSLCVPQKIKSA